MNTKNILKSTLFLIFSITYSATSNAVSDAEFKELQDQLNLVADSIEKNSTGKSDTNIGGYGELHYNNLSNGTGSQKKEIDFHRFVLFFGHEFSNKVRLFSELELEHALSGESKPGEVELEQAYVQIDLDDNMTLSTGVFLIPVGIMNETHEPPTFYGTERNPVGKKYHPGNMVGSRCHVVS